MSESEDDEASLTHTKDEAKAEEARYMARDWLRIAVVAVLATTLAIVGLLQASGIIDLYPPAEGSAQWIVYAGLVVIALAVAVWAWEYFGEVT